MSVVALGRLLAGVGLTGRHESLEVRGRPDDLLDQTRHAQERAEHLPPCLLIRIGHHDRGLGLNSVTGGDVQECRQLAGGSFDDLAPGVQETGGVLDAEEEGCLDDAGTGRASKTNDVTMPTLAPARELPRTSPDPGRVDVPDRAIGRDHLRSAQMVDGQAVGSPQKADAASGREATDATSPESPELRASPHGWRERATCSHLRPDRLRQSGVRAGRRSSDGAGR